MGKARFGATEFGIGIKHTDGETYNYIAVSPDKGTIPQDLFFSANLDFFSFVCLYHLGITGGGTYIWLPSQAVEKYMKAYILRLGEMTMKKIKNKYNHGIIDLWKDYKKLYRYKPSNKTSSFIYELSKVTTHVRYGHLSIFITSKFVSGLLYLAVHFNYYRNSKNYKNTYYGFEEHELTPFNMISGSMKSHILKAYLHLFVEHQVSFSSMGMHHKHEFPEVAMYKQNRKEALCPLCNNPEFSKMLHPTMRSSNIQFLLEKYIKNVDE